MRALTAFTPVLLVMVTCPLVAVASAGASEEALARAAAIVEAERAVGAYVEPQLVAWMADRPVLLWLCGLIYLGAHVPVTGGALILVWLRRPAAFARLAATFIVLQLALAAAWLVWPVAPPRLLPEAVAGSSGPWGGLGESSAGVLQSPFAAFPSGHVAFAVVSCWAVWLTVRSPALRAAALTYPPLIVAITMVTGNHFWLDAAAALVWVAGAAVIVHVVAAAARTRLTVDALALDRR
jgi:membrane-associated phospholipid phosphatase